MIRCVDGSGHVLVSVRAALGSGGGDSQRFCRMHTATLPPLPFLETGVSSGWWSGAVAACHCYTAMERHTIEWRSGTGARWSRSACAEALLVVRGEVSGSWCAQGIMIASAPETMAHQSRCATNSALPRVARPRSATLRCMERKPPRKRSGACCAAQREIRVKKRKRGGAEWRRRGKSWIHKKVFCCVIF